MDLVNLTDVPLEGDAILAAMLASPPPSCVRDAEIVLRVATTQQARVSAPKRPRTSIASDETQAQCSKETRALRRRVAELQQQNDQLQCLVCEYERFCGLLV